MRAWVRDHGAWKRFAFLTDAKWAADATRMFSWVTPGEVTVGEPAEEDEARRWVAG
jgi:hypothetical protein